MIKHLIHGKGAIGAFREIRLDDLLSRTVVIFCTFIPLFGFRELKRVVGEDRAGPPSPLASEPKSKAVRGLASPWAPSALGMLVQV